MTLSRPFLATVVTVLALATSVSADTLRTTEYDLGEATITQPQYPESSPFRSMPVAIRGVVAVPPGPGPFPIALVVHGSYQFCTAPLIDGQVDVYPCPAEDDLRQYEGFSYLAEALAEAGYVALIPDVSAEFNNGYGEPLPGERAIQLLEAHLHAFVSGTGFDAAVAGKGDLDRLVIAGHSRGAPISMGYVVDERWATYDPVALALLAPATAAAKLTIPPHMPAMLMVTTCDGDVGFDQPLAYLDRQLPPTRPTITSTDIVVGGTHNAFSTKLGPDPTDVCEASDILPPDQQRERIAASLPRFFDLALAHLATRTRAGR